MSNDGDLFAPLIAARRAETQRILAELREAARLSKQSRVHHQPLPNVALRNGPFDGLPPNPNAAWGPIPGTSLPAIENRQSEGEST